MEETSTTTPHPPAGAGGGTLIAFGDAPAYLACGPTDLRKQINGLVVEVSAKLGLDPFERALFVFCNRPRDRLKVLSFDGDGFMLLTKRLERGRFRWPERAAGEAAMELSAADLAALLGSTRLERRLMRDEVSERRAY